MPNSLDFEIFHSVSEIDPVSWNQLSAGRPFTSYQWYQYCETVMADSFPTYIIVYHQGQPIGRATFWRIPNEPVPIETAFIRNGVESVFRKWPLLICQSPLSSVSGLVLPDDTSLRDATQTIITNQAIKILHEQGCSFLIFVYLPQEQFTNWPTSLLSTTVPGPGTFMELVWPSFDDYLNAGNKKDRQHYKKTVREAEKLRIQIVRKDQVEQIEDVLSLIRTVEHRFKSPENPWAPAMLKHAGMLNNTTFLRATIDEKLIGCGLLLEDNGAQMNATLGLADNVPYLYFTLVYESIKVAFEHDAKQIRLGTGAYDAKKQLGFSLEDNTSTLFAAANPIFHQTVKWFGKFL